MLKRKKGDHRGFKDLTRTEKRKKVDNKSHETFNDDLKQTAKQKKQELKEAEIASVPRSIIVVRGKYKPEPMKSLCADLRKVMLPFTAKDLDKSGNTKIIDYVEFSKQAHVTHLITLTSSVSLTALNICRLPHGPTLTFDIQNYCTMKNLRNFYQKDLNHQITCDEMSFFKDPAICILNNFTSNESHIQLMSLTFQNMFPPVDVKSFKLSHVKRVALFNFDDEDETIEMRHYGIKKETDAITPFKLGKMKKSANKKLKDVQYKLEKTKEELQELYNQRKEMKEKYGKSKTIEKLQSIEDLSDPMTNLEADIALKEKTLLSYVDKEKNIQLELENIENNESLMEPSTNNPSSSNSFQGESVEVDDMFESNSRTKVKIRLEEIGPRMTLKLRKVVEGVFTGETIYHSVFEDKPQEIKDAERKEKEEKKKLKEQRRKTQEENVEKKKKDKEEKAESQKQAFLKKFQESLENDPDLLDGPLAGRVSDAEDSDEEENEEDNSTLNKAIYADDDDEDDDEVFEDEGSDDEEDDE